MAGRFHTCYSPVRRSPAGEASFAPDAPRLACVRPVASVHPEPGSNSPLLYLFLFSFSLLSRRSRLLPPRRPYPGTATPKFIALFPGVQRIVTWTRLRFLSLSLTVSFVCRNHFNDLCPSCANGRFPRGLTPVFPVCGCKGTTKNLFAPNFFQSFFQVFSPKFRNLPSLSALHHKIFML